MGQGAFIFGCAGARLEPREARFFREADPWGFILFARNVDTPDLLYRLTNELREAVGREAPILIDQEGGRVQRMREPDWREFLPPMEQVDLTLERHGEEGALRAMWLRGRLIAEDLHDVCIDVNCAPTLDVARPDTHPFLRNRCFSDSPDLVAAMGQALVEGMAAGGVAAVMKHLPGHGRGTVDSHLGLPRVTADLEELQTDFAPFKALNDLPMAMSAHIVIDAIEPEVPATHSEKAIALIREEIGFGGLLMTDDVSMEALSGTVVERAQRAIAAGCDLALHCNGDMAEMEALAALGALGEAAQTRANAAADARPTYEPIDIREIDAEFRSLTG
ncbi:glycoside hydrolase family 3 N-terminal domain-containing protein [Celeribacter sp.]|uniref:glycoside hydrolase family 3 N-terminal domain-containing protein n=1 Tax=Celeribacter sp. TaxID=1890673 RepID=UPI003A92C85B